MIFALREGEREIAGREGRLKGRTRASTTGRELGGRVGREGTGTVIPKDAKGPVIGVLDDQIEVQVSVHVAQGEPHRTGKMRQHNLLRGTRLRELNGDGGGTTASGGIQGESHIGDVVAIKIGKGAALSMEGNEASGASTKLVIGEVRRRDGRRREGRRGQVTGGGWGETGEEQERKDRQEPPAGGPGQSEVKMEARSRHHNWGVILNNTKTAPAFSRVKALELWRGPG